MDHGAPPPLGSPVAVIVILGLRVEGGVYPLALPQWKSLPVGWGLLAGIFGGPRREAPPPRRGHRAPMLTFLKHGGDRISPLNYFDRLRRRRGRTRPMAGRRFLQIRFKAFVERLH